MSGTVCDLLHDDRFIKVFGPKHLMKSAILINCLFFCVVSFNFQSYITLHMKVISGVLLKTYQWKGESGQS